MNPRAAFARGCALLMALLAFNLPFSASAQNPYANFDNPLFIPDTLSSWPPNTFSSLHLDVTEDSIVLFPNASASNPPMPGVPYRPSNNLPIKTLAFSSPGLNNPGILGPTVIWWYGDSLTMEVENHLSNATTSHWHGAHVAAGNDGGPHQPIPGNTTWRPSFEVRDDVSTMWYHPHLHDYTFEQVQRGMAGMLIVKSANDPIAAQLPHDYGVNDLPIVFQDKFVQYDPVSMRDTINWCCSLGTIPLVNGTWKAFYEIPDTGLVRLRVLNGSSERSIALSLQVGGDSTALVPFNVIASDAGYINQPYAMNSAAVKTGAVDSILIITPGERYEIVFDAGAGGGSDIFLVNRRDWMKGNTWVETFAGGPSYDNPSCYSDTAALFDPMADPCDGNYHGGMFPNANFDSVPMPLLRMVPTSMPGAPIVSSIPSTLASWVIPPASQASVIRDKHLVGYNPGSGPPFSIDSINFNMQVVNDFPLLGATEIWNIYNSSGVAHPFHMHDIHFFITDIHQIDANGDTTVVPIPPYMAGPKDVMAVGSNSNNFPGNNSLNPQMMFRFITTFTDFGVSPTIDSIWRKGYMYHCHILDHEDGGMMHQFVVVTSPFTGAEEATVQANEWKLYPNPNTGTLSMQSEYTKASSLQLLDVNGKIIREWELGPFNGVRELDLGVQPAGVYLIRWSRQDGVGTKRLMVIHK